MTDTDTTSTGLAVASQTVASGLGRHLLAPAIAAALESPETRRAVTSTVLRVSLVAGGVALATIFLARAFR